MTESADFMKRVARELNLEELESLVQYKAEAENGSIVFFPVVRDKRQVQWQVHVFLKGVVGPLPLSADSIAAIRAPQDWLQKSVALLASLQEGFPGLPVPAKETPVLPKTGAQGVEIDEKR